MTHEEEEKMQHDISKLREQVPQISLSQRVTKNEMEALKNGLKEDMEDLKYDMNVNMEGLTKLLQEMLHNGNKVFHETHDENKRNANNDFKDSNFGLNTNKIQNIDMRNFDGKDLVTWIL